MRVWVLNLTTDIGQHRFQDLGSLAGNVILGRGPRASLTPHLTPLVSADFDEINTCWLGPIYEASKTCV